MSVVLEPIRAAGSPLSCLVLKATGQGEEKIWVGIISIVALLQTMLFFLCEKQMLFLLFIGLSNITS